MTQSEDEREALGADVDDAASSSVRIARVRHPLRLVAFSVGAAVLLVAAFIAGGMVRSPASDAIETAQKQLPVVVSVESRVVDAGFSVPATIVPAGTADVIVTEASLLASSELPAAESPATGTTTEAPVPETERVMVSRTVLSRGDIVHFGELAAEVAGRPVFAVPSSVPLYRDLVTGATGTDVRVLQQWLVDLDYYGVRVNGVFDSGTQGALSRMYDAAGYTLPYVSDGVRGLAWREFVVIPGDNLQVENVAAVGAILSAEVPLMTVQTSPATLSAQLTATQRERAESAGQVGVSVAGAAPVPTTIVAIGAFATDATTGASGYPLTVSIPAGATVDAATAVRITNADQPDATLAIPAIALRQDGARTYVVLGEGQLNAESPSPPTTVDVTVTAQADGWVSIEPAQPLTVGTDLLVEP